MNQIEELNKAAKIAGEAAMRLLKKSHVSATTYTNSHGTVVNRAEHEDSRNAARKRAIYEKLANKAKDASHQALADARDGKLSGHKKAAEAHRKAMDAAKIIGDQDRVKWHKDLVGYHEKGAGVDIRTPERRLANRQNK